MKQLGKFVVDDIRSFNFNIGDINLIGASIVNAAPSGMSFTIAASTLAKIDRFLYWRVGETDPNSVNTMDQRTIDALDSTW